MDGPDNPTIADVIAIGPIPPPVTGMTVLTERVIQGLREAGAVRFFNWSPAEICQGVRFRLTRLARMVRSLFWLMKQGPGRGRFLYTVANSESGMYLSGLVVWLGRRVGYRIALHHHTYIYIDRYSRCMAWMDRAMGSDSIHVVHCKKMIGDFQAKYPSRCEFAEVYPSVVSLEVKRPKSAPGRPFCIGHLSNLTEEKGIDLVVRTFESLHDAGNSVSLKIAGPFRTTSSRKLVDDAIRRYGELVEYFGPVHGEAKANFYANLNAFLFPTRYKNESWGIVLNESLSTGVPTIAFDRGCIETVVGERAGLVVDREGDFVGEATKLIRHWIDSPEAYAEASRAAVEQAEHLNREGARQLAMLARRLARASCESGCKLAGDLPQ